MTTESRPASYFRVVFEVVFAPVPIACVWKSDGCGINVTPFVAGAGVKVLAGATPAWRGFRRHQPDPAPAVAWRVAPDRTSVFAPGRVTVRPY